MKVFCALITPILFMVLHASAADPQTLHLFAMSDYMPSEVIQSFEKKFNAKIKYDNFSNNEEMLAKFQSGAKGYDVIIPSDYMIRALVEGGYLVDLDHSKLPNLKNIAKEFVDTPYDPKNKHTVPYTWGTTGLIYNSKLVKESITSWKQLADPKYKGKVALLDDSREVFGAMLRSAGHSCNSTKTDDLRAAQAELIKIKPSVRLFSSDPKQHVLSGDIWIAQIYSGDAFQINKKKPELRYVVPKEGATVWVDTLAIPKSARNTELAYAFLNYLLDPVIGAKVTEELGYASPNKAAEKKIKDKTLKAQNIVKLGASKLEFLKDLGSSADQIDQLWTEAKMK